MPNRRNSLLYNSSYEYQKEVNRQEKIDREELSIKLQFDLTKRIQDLETTLQKQREIDRQETANERETDFIQRQKERHSDRWFSAGMLIIAAILGGLVAKLLDIFFK